MANSSSEDALPVHADPDIMSGTPVFLGTRVPAQTLFDYLMDGCSIEKFLENFPTVRREQAMALIASAARQALEGMVPVESAH